jgi:TusA-related sulfurtransferase
MNTATKAEHFLDITDFVCPMTFVHTKLLIERIAPGETAEIRLNAGEPLKNVPRSLKEHGHEVLSLAPEPGADDAGPYRLLVRKR